MIRGDIKCESKGDPLNREYRSPTKNDEITVRDYIASGYYSLSFLFPPLVMRNIINESYT